MEFLNDLQNFYSNIEKIAEVTGKSPLEIEQYLQSNRQ